MKTLSITKIALLVLFASLCFIFVSSDKSFATGSSSSSSSSSSASTAPVSTASTYTDNNDLVTVMCNALKLVTGNAGKTFAAFAIISMGIGFFTGKVSWGLIIGVMLGIAAVFGAPTIVAAIGGGNAVTCNT